jgi:hypothetical protein
MANLIPGYNYDIFISYRQKDNEEGEQESGRARSERKGDSS